MRSASSFSLLLALLFATGCASVAEQPVGTASIPESPATAEEQRERAVQTAVQTAFGLEAALFSDAEAVSSREGVAAHFRRGFVHALAQDFADYYWQRGRVQTGPPTLLVPDVVTVLRASERSASAYFETPAALRATWDLPRYTLVEMEREGDRWLVAATAQQEHRPE